MLGIDGFRKRTIFFRALRSGYDFSASVTASMSFPIGMMNPLITRLRMLTPLAEDDLQLLEEICTATRRVSPHEDIAPQGERPKKLHVVVEGWAARYQTMPDGSQQFPALLLPGDICDMDAYMLRRVHTGVCALTECVVAELPLAQLKALLAQNTRLQDVFWWLHCVENAIAAEWCVGLGGRLSDARLAHLFCELHVRLGTVGLSTDKGYEMPLTQRDLADALGLSSVHINRRLQEMRRAGVIRLSGSFLTILNYTALKAMAGFDPAYLHTEGFGARLR